jgi:hypothetical protein
MDRVSQELMEYLAEAMNHPDVSTNEEESTRFTLTLVVVS